MRTVTAGAARLTINAIFLAMELLQPEINVAPQLPGRSMLARLEAQWEAALEEGLYLCCAVSIHAQAVTATFLDASPAVLPALTLPLDKNGFARMGQTQVSILMIGQRFRLIAGRMASNR